MAECTEVVSERSDEEGRRENDLRAALIRCDEEAWADIYESLATGLRGHARRKHFDRAAANDLVQETFFTLFELIHNIPKDAPLKGFAFGILKNKIREAWRKRARVEEGVEVEDREEFTRGPGTRVAEEEEQRIWRKIALRCLNRLSGRVKPEAALALEGKLLGRPDDEVARLIGRNVNGTRALRNRLGSLLKSELEKEGLDPTVLDQGVEALLGMRKPSDPEDLWTRSHLPCEPLDRAGESGRAWMEAHVEWTGCERCGTTLNTPESSPAELAEDRELGRMVSRRLSG